MKTEQLDKFRILLEKERDVALKIGGTEQIKEIRVQGDEGDEATALFEQHMIVKFNNRQKNILDKINHALKKIKDGEYGLCEDCGEEIGIKRLEIRPTTKLCIKCKEHEEKIEKIYSKSSET